MKKFLMLALCMLMVLTAVGCGRDEAKEADIKGNTEQNQKAEADTDKGKDAVVEKNENETTNSSSETKQVVVESAENLEEIIDEFNTTTDPDRKDELRKELEKIFAEAENAARQAE